MAQVKVDRLEPDGAAVRDTWHRARGSKEGGFRLDSQGRFRLRLVAFFFCLSGFQEIKYRSGCAGDCAEIAVACMCTRTELHARVEDGAEVVGDALVGGEVEVADGDDRLGHGEARREVEALAGVHGREVLRLHAVDFGAFVVIEKVDAVAVRDVLDRLRRLGVARDLVGAALDVDHHRQVLLLGQVGDLHRREAELGHVVGGAVRACIHNAFQLSVDVGVADDRGGGNLVQAALLRAIGSGVVVRNCRKTRREAQKERQVCQQMATNGND